MNKNTQKQRGARTTASHPLAGVNDFRAATEVTQSCCPTFFLLSNEAVGYCSIATIADDNADKL